MESDPVEVLKVWRRFSAEMADMTSEEEGIYDDEFKEATENRLKNLRKLRIEQPILDDPITAEEVFRAVRRMKMGKAPGVDGVLSSILRHAADAVGTNKLKPGNSVIEAMVLMFNYVFYKEEWPERWAVELSFLCTNKMADWSQEITDPLLYFQSLGKSLAWSLKADSLIGPSPQGQSRTSRVASGGIGALQTRFSYFVRSSPVERRGTCPLS